MKIFRQYLKSVSCVILILLGLISSISNSPRAISAKIPEKVEPFSQEGLYIDALALGRSQCEKIFNHDLIRKGVVPVHIRIQNQTKKTFYLSKRGVTGTLLSPGKVATLVSLDTLPRGIVLKVASLFFWPMMIPSTFEGIISLRSHMSVKSDLEAKTVKDKPEAILPYSTLDRVILVPKQEYNEMFTLHLQEGRSGKFIPFEVTINS